MKIKSGFVLHSIGTEHMVVPVEERTMEFRGMIRLNETGVYLWSQMQSECDAASLAADLAEKYGISGELAREAVASFVGQLSQADVIEP